ncbi:MAG: PorV/PorQ family protein [Flavobacteriales bacterium]
MKLKITLLSLATFFSISAMAGNEDRIGSAGSTQLLINPWARSSAWAGAGGAHIKGLGALQLNVAGLALADKTEIEFTNTTWMQSTGININSFGLAQRIGESSVLGVSMMTVNYGDIPITTTELPEGGLGTFSPSSFLLNIAYAREFSATISGGINIKILSEGIANARANGVAFDAGVRYVTGERDQIKIGLALKNVGPPMSYSGDGFAIETINPFTEISTTTEQRTANFELPSLINISAAYDFLINENNSLVAAATFTSNSFQRDQFRVGAEYSLRAKKVIVLLRAGLAYERGIFSEAETLSALSGPSAGVSIDMPFGKNESTIGIDYSFRTAPFLGAIHGIGVRLNLAGDSED